MSSIATSIVVICSSLITASLVKMLAPSGNTDKILKLVISIFILICVVVCIKPVVSNIDFSEIKDSEMSNSIINNNENVLKVTGDYMVQYTDKLLKSQGIEAELIKLTVDADDKGVINISSINIYIDKINYSDMQKISELIEKDLNVTPSIIIKD